jgi:hypothetical protein
MLFVTILIVMIFLNRPRNGALLFVLYAIERFLCHGFMLACYDVVICEANMNRINTKPQTASFTMTTASMSDASTLLSTSRVPAGRLIVLVPSELDYSALTRRIWQLAIATGKPILFLSLCQDAAEEPSLRRQLVTLSALVGDSKVSTGAKVEIGANWVDIVKTNYQAGDVIVCFAEQRTGLFHRPLSQILESNLGAPVYILSGLYPQSASRSDWLSQIIVWMGSFGILAGFFWLQVRISQLPQDGSQTALLILSAAVEIWLIWVWNSLFS